MKKFLLFAAFVLLSSVTLPAQPGGGMMGGMMRLGQRAERNAGLVAAYSEFMVEKYKLNGDQAGKVRQLNDYYVGKISFPIPYKLREAYRKEHQPEGWEGNENARMDSTARAMREQFRNMGEMTDEQRQEMMDQMQKRMEEAQAAADLMDEYMEAYEGELQQILDKGQYKAYKKEVAREQEREQRRREGEMRRQFERAGGFGGFGGPGGPGGGFGGPGGGF